MRSLAGFRNATCILGRSVQTPAGEFNTNDGGRGVYWEDPSGHFLEIITRPYGSGG